MRFWFTLSFFLPSDIHFRKLRFAAAVLYDCEVLYNNISSSLIINKLYSHPSPDSLCGRDVIDAKEVERFTIIVLGTCVRIRFCISLPRRRRTSRLTARQRNCARDLMPSCTSILSSALVAVCAANGRGGQVERRGYKNVQPRPRAVN